jgi:phosphate transport system substrate-binding protein
VLTHDHDMQEALLSTPGAVGLFDLGAMVSQDLPLKVLALGGISPSPERVMDGAYPLSKELAFVCQGAPRGPAARLLDFVFSAAGRALILSEGYIPLPRRGR